MGNNFYQPTVFGRGNRLPFPRWSHNSRLLLEYHLSKKGLVKRLKNIYTTYTWKRDYKNGWDVPRAVHNCLQRHNLDSNDDPSDYSRPEADAEKRIVSAEKELPF